MMKSPKKGAFIETLLLSSRTIFSTQDMALLWSESDKKTITNRLKKYVQAGKLLRVRRGLYAKNKNYNRLELATRINTPAYISFETVLTNTGVNFQHYNSIYIASYRSREIVIDDQRYIFIKIKDDVLSNTIGIKHENNIAIASRERAFLDCLYVNKEYYFDNIGSIDWDTAFNIVPIYQNKRLEKTLEKYYKQYKK